MRGSLHLLRPSLPETSTCCALSNPDFILGDANPYAPRSAQHAHHSRSFSSFPLGRNAHTARTGSARRNAGAGTGRGAGTIAPGPGCALTCTRTRAAGIARTAFANHSFKVADTPLQRFVLLFDRVKLRAVKCCLFVAGCRGKNSR